MIFLFLLKLFECKITVWNAQLSCNYSRAEWKPVSGDTPVVVKQEQKGGREARWHV